MNSKKKQTLRIVLIVFVLQLALFVSEAQKVRDMNFDSLILTKIS